MKRSSGLLLALPLLVVLALFLAPPIQAEERVKLTGDEIKEILFTRGKVIFGVDHVNDTVWIGTALGDGKRHIYWRSHIYMTTGELTGTARIVNDQQCAVGYAQDRCFDIYRVGSDKYESWSGETLFSTWYRAN
ncbi:MAG: hypothetical protein JSU95_03290 [Betaproteobacteria bacterium]|nr:MAG: hypothetical protein JSU95_03290 [Betaproteobacteria bacterium]